jgi:hypothetical protein
MVPRTISPLALKNFWKVRIQTAGHTENVHTQYFYAYALSECMHASGCIVCKGKFYAMRNLANVMLRSLTEN